MKPGAAPREQRLSNLLSREENEGVFSLFGPRCESLATTIIQIFVTSAPEHSDWSKLDSGVLCLIKDHLKRSYYFRVYCPERRSLIWEHEVYNSMQYNAPRPFLHTFEAQDCIVAFNFASEDEADWLRGILLNKLESKKQRRERRLRNSYHPREPLSPKVSSHVSNGVVSTGNKFTSNAHTPAAGTPSKIKDVKNKTKRKDDKRLTKAVIGTPYNFRHISHVGWDVDKGFDTNLGEGESPQLKAFFEKAGVSDSQLQDQATRDFIYEFIHHNGGIDRVVNEVAQNETSTEKIYRESSYVGATRHERDGPGPPPLPMRNTPIASRAAPPPPPSRAMPAPPPPSQAPPPPPPLRILPQQQHSTGGGPPPPPPPPPAIPVAPPAPPLPSTPSPGSQDTTHQSSDTHSALMESIRSGTTLRKVDVESESKNTDSRGELLTQIRQGISLRPVQPVTKSLPSGPPENSLADALARALAERSRFIHSESSTSSDDDDDDDDDEWED